jgi:membrane fusion protein, copper/silver efflux system
MKQRHLIILIVLVVAAVVTAPPALAQSQGHQHGTSGKAQPQKERAVQAPTIEIPPEKQQLIGLKTAVVSMRPLERTLRTVGRVEYDERKLANITTKVEGWIEKLHVNYTGTYVKKGEPLAEIYSPELWATQQEFINALKWQKRSKKEGGEQEFGSMLAADAESLVAATRQRLKLWDISDAQIANIEEGEKPRRTLTVYSPASGYVTQKQVVQGAKVMAGEKLFEVADLSTVWVLADIYEYELPLVKVGDQARISLSYFPGKGVTSAIDYIYPTMSAETRTAKARFTVTNPEGLLKPQMFTDVEFKVQLGKRLAVPAEAVIDTGLRNIVYVDKGEGNFEPREVSVGLRAEKFIEITGGLKAGEKVASAANFLIDSEAKLKGVAPLPTQKQGPRAQGVEGSSEKTAPPPAHKH